MDDAYPATPAARLEIDRGALTQNWKRLAERSAPAECAAAVKADGYGLGLETVVDALRDAGCKTFFVAFADEALRARRVAQDADIYVLCGISSGRLDDLVAARARPALLDREEVDIWSARCRADGIRRPAALHIESGINRAGMRPDDVNALLNDPTDRDVLDIDLILSHAARADEPENPMTEQQISTFALRAQALREKFPDARLSFANSYCLKNLPDASRFDLTRPGLALYGGVDGMRAAFRLSAPLIQCRVVEIGESVGYGATWTASRRSRVGIIPLGYADGYPRPRDDALPADAVVVDRHGRRAPVIGRTSMDMIAVDLTDAPEEAMRRGTRMEAIGPRVPLPDVARAFNASPYEILVGLGRRCERVVADELNHADELNPSEDV